MQWLQKFMMGRYGSDQLNVALILLSLALNILFSFLPIGYAGSVLALIPLCWAIYRMLSRRADRRFAENRIFLKVWNPVRNWFQRLYLSLRFGKKNRYFLCPKCARIACIPRGTGRVTIICKTCHTRYDKKA